MHLKREKGLLESRNQELLTLMDYMAFMSDAQATDALTILRMTKDPGRVLRSINGDGLERELLLSLHSAMKASLGPAGRTMSSRELTLITRWPNTYPKDEEWAVAGGGIEEIMRKSPLLMKKDVLDRNGAAGGSSIGKQRIPGAALGGSTLGSDTLTYSHTTSNVSSKSSGFASAHPGLAVMLGMPVNPRNSVASSDPSFADDPSGYLAQSSAIPPKFPQLDPNRLNIRRWTSVSH
jgi:hypothetical protein